MVSIRASTPNIPASAASACRQLLFRRGTSLFVPFLLAYPKRFFYGVAISFSEIGVFLSRFRVFPIAVVVHDLDRCRPGISECDFTLAAHILRLPGPFATSAEIAALLQ